MAAGVFHSSDDDLLVEEEDDDLLLFEEEDLLVDDELFFPSRASVILPANSVLTVPSAYPFSEPVSGLTAIWYPIPDEVLLLPTARSWLFVDI